MKPILLIKTGATMEQIKTRYGDFEDWFTAGLGVTDLLTVDVYRQQPLPVLDGLAGIVITGSASMVSAREDWSERTAKWLATAVGTGVPVLGVCYGHQLLAHALGGRVGPNPAGRQMGTVTTQLCEAAKQDPLLQHLPASFLAQTSHSEVVLEPPPNAVRLASCSLDDNFSIRFAEKVWGVQFHPEFSPAVMSEYISLRADAIAGEGLDPNEMLDSVTDTEQANTVLERFKELLSD